MPNRGVHHAAHNGAHRAAHNGAHRGVRTIALPWRKAYVALPAIGLIAVGTALVAPGDAVKGVTVSKDPTAVVVPGAALTLHPARSVRCGHTGGARPRVVED